MPRSDADALLAVLPVLVAFADTGQVTSAASALGLPQPSVTRALQRAESQLGVALYERDGRGARLTPKGEALLPHARTALTAIEDGLAALAKPVRGRVGISFQNSLGEDIVPALLRAFLADHPDVDFTLIQGSRAHCLELLDGGRCDVAFVSPPPEAHTLTNTTLLDDELVAVLPSRHPLARRATVRLSELADEPFVMLAPGFGLRSTVQSLLDDADVHPVFAFDGQDIHTLLGLVSAGLGVAILPRRRRHAHVAQLRIVGHRAARTVVMSRPTSRTYPAAVEAFIGLVEEQGAALVAAEMQALQAG